jgi:photosystem II stability/assembly factor-like uncharacterized protein
MRTRFWAVLATSFAASLWFPQHAQQPGERPVLQLPVRQAANNSWQISWSSVAGRQYQLQRSHDLGSWTEVTTLTAGGPTTTAVDPQVPNDQRTFWRVIQLGAAPDLTPPTLSDIQVKITESNGQPALELRVRAQDNVAVTQVGFMETGADWVDATPALDQTFARVVAFNPSDPRPREFQARAGDAAGNFGFSEVVTFAPRPPVPGLVALGLGGNPLAQGFIGQRADGSLTPFVYVPDNRGGAAPAASAQLVFPEGAKVVEQGGQTYLEYRSLQFRFGRQSALQIAASAPPAQRTARLAREGARLAAAGSTATDALSVELPEGQSARLPLGPLTVAQLEEAFGLAAGSGIPVKLFDRFPLRLLSGTLKDDGIHGANWGLDQLGLPLPPFTGDWAGSVFDLLTTGEGKFPLYGEIPLKGLGDDAPTLSVAKKRPLVLTLRADGEVALEGPACLAFPSGVKFCVGVTLDDPKYCLSLRAEGLTVPLIDSLADLLPSNPASCIPNVSTDANLDAAEACLLEFRRAYDQFAQAALTVRPDATEDAGALFPPETINALSAIADAWVASALTPVVQTLPVQELRNLPSHLGQAARGASDSRTAARYLATLARLRAAVNTYAEKTPPNGDEIPAVRAQLDAAIGEAVAAVDERSKEPDSISSLAATTAILEDLRQVRDLADTFTPDQLTKINAARDRIVDGFWAKFTSALGIRANVFNHDDNPVVNALNRFTAQETVGQVTEFLGAAQAVGRDPDTLPLLEETTEQLFGRAFEVVLGNLDTALVEENVPAGMVAIRELVDVIAQWDFLALADGDEDFPTVEDAQLLLVELGEITERQLELPREQQSLFNVALRVRALLAVLESVPPDTQFPFPAITAAHSDLKDALNLAIGLAPVNDDLNELLEILRASTLYIRFGLRFGLANEIDWEATKLTEVVNRFGEVALQQKAHSQLDQALRFLFEEGDRLEADAARLATAGDPAANTRQSSRRLYYLRAVDLLGRSREIASVLWTEAETRRAQTPGEFSADAFLPGDLKIDAIAGSVCYNHSTRRLSGAFSGKLRLPKLDRALTIANASISNEGDFDLNAHGQLQLPGGSPAATLIVPARQPLRISHTQKDGLGIAGKARLRFNNGVFFEAGIDFNDPLYTVEAAAGGFEVDLAKALAAVLPLGLEPEDLANLARGQLWSDYFTFLSACFETGYRPENEVDPVIPGTLPTFTGGVAGDLSCLLDAWSCLMLAEAERGSLERYRSTYETVGEILSVLDSGLQEGLSGFAELFGPANEFEIGYQLRRLQKVALSYAKISRALKAIVDRDPTDAQAIDFAQVRLHLDRAAALWLGVANKLDDNVNFLRDRAMVAVVVRAGLDLVAAYQLLGLDDGAGLSLAPVTNFLNLAATEFALTAGLNRANGQINAALIAGFTHDQALDKARGYLDTVADLQLAGMGEPVSTALLEALLNRMRDVALAEIGFNSVTGQFNLASVGDEAIQRGLARLAALPAEYQSVGLNHPDLPAAFAGIGASLHERFLQRDAEQPPSRWPARKAYLFALLRLDLLRQIEGLPSLLDAAFDARMLSMLGQMLAEARGRLSQDQIDVLELVTPRLPAHPIWAPPLQARLVAAATALDAETTRPWTEADLALAPALANELLALDRFSRVHASLNLTGPHTTASILGSLAGRLETTGRAVKRAKRLSEVAGIFEQAAGDSVHAALAPELQARARQLLNAAREIAQDYQLKLNALAEADKPLDFQLPASLKIKRVFGSVFYRRDTAFLRGTFGGRLEFPNEKAFFEISQATLDNTGAFSIAAATGFPLEPAGNANLQATASLAVAGTPVGLSSVTGSGQLKFRLDADPQSALRTVDVSVSYDASDPNRPLRFTGALGAAGVPAVRFSDDFVLFNGNVTAEFSLANVGDFALRIGGKAGFFHREQPLADPIEGKDFFVFVDISGLGISYQQDALVARFDGGSLTLAPELFKALEELAGGEFIPTDDPVTIPIPFSFSVGYHFAQGKPIFSAGGGAAQAVGLAAEGAPQPLRFTLPPLHFGIPGLPGSDVQVRACELEFFEDRFPVLRQLQAALAFPMPGVNATDPGANRTVQFVLGGENWRVDGFPDAASISIGQSIRVLDLDGVDVDLLGGAGFDPNCAASMSFASETVNGTRQTRLTLAGGLRGTFDPNLLFDAGVNAAASFTACGSFAWRVGALPEFALTSVAFAGNFRLGGPNGIAIKGARTTGATQAQIALVNLQNAFIRTTDAPFLIRVEGALDIANFIEFGLEQSAFVWDTTGSLVPRFEPGGFYGALGEDAIEMAGEVLPLYPTLIGLRFKNPALPLFPPAGQMGLFDPANVIALVSGVVSLPNGAAIASGSPGIFGAVNELGFSFKRQGDLVLPEPPSLDGFCLQLQNLDIPPLGGITGGICLGNLQSLLQNPPRPQDIYFAGQVGAKFQDIGAEVILATKPLEFIGACFSLNAGPAGIPLDGGTLGGILLTGGKGGLNFKNSFADPCDFRSYIDLAAGTGNVPAPGSPERPGNPPDPPDPVIPPDFSSGPITCVSPPFPPATVNPLCEIHPTTGRVIFKGTRLSEAQVNALGLTRATLAGLNPAQVIDLAVNQFTGEVQKQFNAALALADSFNPPADARSYFVSLGQNVLNSFDDAAKTFFREVFRTVLNANPAVDLYDTLIVKAAEGIPCFDTTLKLEGTFSHAAISTVLSGSGGVTVSSTGTSVLEGRINLIGIPVGEGTFAVSLTDSTGAINPAFGGLIRAALGPLEFGNLSLALSCDGCTTVVLEEFGALLACQGGVLTGNAAEFIYQMLDRAFRERAPHSRAVTLVNHFNALTPQQQLGFVGSFFNVFQAQLNGEPLPVAVTQQTLNEFLLCFEEFIVRTLPRVNPSLCFSGAVGPKLFGFPLTGGADAVFGATMLFGRKHDPNLNEDFQELAAQVQYSPTYMLLAPLVAISQGTFPAAIDQAGMGFSLRVPAWTPELVRTALTDPLGYAESQMTTFINDAVFTFNYQFQPLGFKLANGQGRVILPRLDTHPRRPGVNWELPAANDVATRAQVILAALNKGKLQDPTWRGSSGELDDLFILDPQNPPLAGTCAAIIADASANVAPAAMAPLSFARDYFPHGGFIGGAELALPSVLADAPPVNELATLLDFSDGLRWLNNAQFVFEQYLTKTTCAGQLAFYLPAPNPPADFPWDQGSVNALLEALRQGDFAAVIARNASDLYPLNEIVFGGWMEAPLFGTPLGRAEVSYRADRRCFEAHALVPANTWLGQFVNGSIDLTLKAPKALEGKLDPKGAVEFFQERLELLKAPGTQVNAQLMQDTAQLVQDFLPKASFEAAANVQIPAGFQAFLRTKAGVDFGVFGFSPFFQPDFEPGNESPYALAKRRGGFGLRGSFELGYFPVGVDPSQYLIISVPDASFAIIPPAQVPDPISGFFPALAGQLVVSEIQLPNLFAFNNQSGPPFRFKDGLLRLNTSPAIGETLIAVEGKLSPLDLGPFLSVRPLPQNANPDNLLGGTLRVKKTATLIPAVDLALRPAAVTVPLFGPSLTGRIFGSFDAASGLFTDFTFSTVAGQAWHATLQLDGRLEIRSPLDPTGPILFQAEALKNEQGAPIPFVAELDGVGLESITLRLTIPNGLEFVLFPGTPHASRMTLGSNSATCLFVSTDGRIYFDSGTQTLDLAGVGSVRGRVEFGFEPVDRTPTLTHTTPAAFSTSLGRSQTRTVTVSNSNARGSVLEVDATGSDQNSFSVTPNRLVLGPGQSANLTVRFTPRSAAITGATLRLANNSTRPLFEVPLTAAVVTSPKLHVSVAAVDFGLTPLGQPKTHAIRVSNLGDGPLLVTDIVTSGAPFTDNRTTATVAAGASTDILVAFTPTTTASVTGTLTFNTSDPTATQRTINLSGQGSDRFWYRQRRGHGLDSLAGIAVRTNGKGFAAGLNGAFLAGDKLGRVWIEDRRAGSPDLRFVAMESDTLGWTGGLDGTVLSTSNGGADWVLSTHKELSDSKNDWQTGTIFGTSRLAIAGRRDGKARIVVENETGGDFTVSVTPAEALGLNGIAFGTATVGLAVGDGATILKTTDGAKTWQLLDVPTGVEKTTRLRAVAVNPSLTANYVIVGDGGLILRTTDAGATWTIRDSATKENLHGVARTDSNFFAVGDRGTIRRGSTSGLNWFVEDANTATDFRAVTTSGANAWAVSDDGDIFHRQPTPISGPIAVVNVSELAFGRIGEGERAIREVTVANEGTANLTAELKGDERFVVAPKGSQTVPPGGEQIFTVTVESKGGGSFGTTLPFDCSDPAVGSLKLDTTVLVRGKDFTPLPFIVHPAQLDLGNVLVGRTADGEITVVNIGQAPLQLHNLEFRHDQTAAHYDVEVKEAKDAGEGGVLLAVSFRASAPGRYQAELEVASNAGNGLVTIEVVANVIAEPEVIVVETNPRGLSVTANGVVRTAPFALTVVEGAPADTTQVQRGSTVTLSAFPALNRDSVRYEFQRWNPGATAGFSFVAGESVRKFTAVYAPTPLPAAAPPTPPEFRASPCNFAPPVDVDFGPWVKITQARLTVPWLGDGVTGSNFRVDGSLFLSLQRAYGSLTSSRIRALVPVTAPAFGGTELLEITPGSWNFDIDAAGRFALSALSPGVQVLNASALPPTQLVVEVDLKESSANRRAFARFATLDELPLAPGLLALGPGATEFEVHLSSAFVRLGLNGSLLALADPDGTGWVVNRPFNFNLKSDVSALGGVEFPVRTQLADLGLVRVHADAGGRIGPLLNSGVWSLTADKIMLEFFRNGAPILTTTTFAADGTFQFDGQLPTAGITAGPVRLKPKSSTAPARAFSVAANPFQARLAASLPGLFFNSTGGLWPNDQVASGPLRFDTAEFDFRLPLPTMNLSGDLVGIGLKEQEQDSDNFFEFSRTTTTTTLRLRNQQDLVLGALKVKLDVSNSGGLSGALAGRLGLEGPPPLDGLTDRVSVELKPKGAPQFVLNRFVFGTGCRLQFGDGVPALGQGCVLTPSDKPLEDWSPAVCLP